MDKISQKISILIYFASIIAVAVLMGFALLYNTDIRGAESNVVYTIQLILESNGNLYQNPEEVPFNITQYSPLYYMICDGLLTLTRISSNNYEAIRIITRGFSIFMLLISCLYIFNILNKKLHLPIRDSLIYASLFLIFIFPWYNLSRPDVLLPFFFLITLDLVLEYGNTKRNLHGILIGLTLFLGFASKLNMLFFLPGLGLFFLYKRYWKMILVSALTFILSAMIFYLIAEFIGYDLKYLKENIIDGINNGYDFSKAFYKPYQNFFSYFAFFFLALILLSINTFKKLKNDDTFILLLLMNITLFGIAIISALKVGSSINYFNEFLLCMILLLGYIMNRAYFPNRGYYMVLIMIFGCSIAVRHTFVYTPFLITNNMKYATVKEESEIALFLSKNLNDKYFFSDNRNLNMALFEHCVLFPRDIHDLTYRRKIYDYSKVQDFVNDGKLKYLVLTKGNQFLYGVDFENKFALKGEYTFHNVYELRNGVTHD